MVNGPGSVILAARSVLRAQELPCRAPRPRCVRRILPTTRGTGVRAPGAVGDRRRVVVVDAVERGGEAVGVALAAHLAVGDDVDAGALHVADREERGVVLRLLEVRLRDAPQLVHAHARHHGREHGAVDQPVGLRVAADDGGRQQMFGHANALRLIS